MVGDEELHSFYMKFVNLCKYGSDDKLFVETIKSNAFVNLQVSRDCWDRTNLILPNILMLEVTG